MEKNKSIQIIILLLLSGGVLAYETTDGIWMYGNEEGGACDSWVRVADKGLAETYISDYPNHLNGSVCGISTKTGVVDDKFVYFLPYGGQEVHRFNESPVDLQVFNLSVVKYYIQGALVGDYIFTPNSYSESVDVLNKEGSIYVEDIINLPLCTDFQPSSNIDSIIVYNGNDIYVSCYNSTVETSYLNKIDPLFFDLEQTEINSITGTLRGIAVNDNTVYYLSEDGLSNYYISYAPLTNPNSIISERDVTNDGAYNGYWREIQLYNGYLYAMGYATSGNEGVALAKYQLNTSLVKNYTHVYGSTADPRSFEIDNGNIYIGFVGTSDGIRSYDTENLDYSGSAIGKNVFALGLRDYRGDVSVTDVDTSSINITNVVDSDPVNLNEVYCSVSYEDSFIDGSYTDSNGIISFDGLIYNRYYDFNCSLNDTKYLSVEDRYKERSIYINSPLHQYSNVFITPTGEGSSKTVTFEVYDNVNGSGIENAFVEIFVSGESEVYMSGYTNSEGIKQFTVNTCLLDYKITKLYYENSTGSIDSINPEEVYLIRDYIFTDYECSVDGYVTLNDEIQERAEIEIRCFNSTTTLESDFDFTDEFGYYELEYPEGRQCRLYYNDIYGGENLVRSLFSYSDNGTCYSEINISYSYNVKHDFVLLVNDNQVNFVNLNVYNNSEFLGYLKKDLIGNQYYSTIFVDGVQYYINTSDSDYIMNTYDFIADKNNLNHIIRASFKENATLSTIWVNLDSTGLFNTDLPNNLLQLDFYIKSDKTGKTKIVSHSFSDQEIFEGKRFVLADLDAFDGFTIEVKSEYFETEEVYVSADGLSEETVTFRLDPKSNVNYKEKIVEAQNEIFKYIYWLIIAAFLVVFLFFVTLIIMFLKVIF